MKNPPIQHPLPPAPAPSSTPKNLLPPPRQLIAPPAPDQHPADHIHHPDHQPQKRHALLPHRQQNRLDVELEEDARDGAFVHGVRLRGRGVLVRDDGVARAVIRREGRRVVRVVGRGGRQWRRGGGAGVDGGDDGEVVLEFIEVIVRGGGGAVEGVEEGRVEGTEGEFVDDVGEVEGWI